jgi:Omp85 superfamily domain
VVIGVRLTKALMNKLLVAAIICSLPLAGCDVNGDDEKALQELNVNAKYLVESVEVSGQKTWHISDALRKEVDKMVGSKLDYPALDRLAERIKKELRVPAVSVNVGKGTVPDHVVVNFEVPKAHEQPLEVNVAKFLYDSKLGWNGEGAGSTTIKGNTFTFGMISDNDSMIERFAGIKVKYERKHVGTDRLRFHFEFDSYHDQWSQATLLASDQAGLYRSRQVFTPEATLILATPLELDFGSSFSRFRPEQPGANTESSNAVVSTLRYHQRWGSARDVEEQELSASYSMRAGIRAFETDTDFTRQMGQARYRFRRDHNSVEVGFLTGAINGNAPLFEKFVAGNATVLRGWNKFDLDPLGGSHIVQGSIDYSFHWLQVFYDTGAIWDVPQEREQKQSVGAGFKVEGFQLAVAFPIRSGRMEPIFYAGLNF